MSGFGFALTIDDGPLLAGLDRLAALDADGLHPALDAIGAAMVSNTVLHFDSGIGPGGLVWKPSKRVQQKGGKTLILSTRLVGSITHNVFGSAVEWGTNVIYAAVHQLGATFSVFARSQQIFRRTDKAKSAIEPSFVSKRRSNFASWSTIPEHSVTIPARPFIGFDREDEAESLAMLREAMVRAITGSAANFLGAV
jgi:phage gpG-like protein